MFVLTSAKLPVRLFIAGLESIESVYYRQLGQIECWPAGEVGRARSSAFVDNVRSRDFRRDHSDSLSRNSLKLVDFRHQNVGILFLDRKLFF